jgi:hypothetical protein
MQTKFIGYGNMVRAAKLPAAFGRFEFFERKDFKPAFY